MKIDRMILWRPIAALALIAAACSSSPAATAPAPFPTGPSPAVSAASSLSSAPAAPAGLTADEASALNSLTTVDGYPLYTMELRRSVEPGSAPETPPQLAGGWNTSWACSLFAALSNPQHRLFGRNFDWDYSPALLLSYFPSDG